MMNDAEGRAGGPSDAGDEEEEELLVVPGPDDDLGVVTGVSRRDDVWVVGDSVDVHDPDNPVSQVARRSSLPASAPVSVPPPPIPEEDRADLSPRLVRLFREADRRVFPDELPMELTFDASEEPARLLVPDDLLDAVHVPPDAREEDPFDAFTYIGSPPEVASDSSLPMLSTPSFGPRAPDTPSRPPRTHPHELSAVREPVGAVVQAVEPTGDGTAAELAFGAPTSGGGRAGKLAEDEVVAFLLALSDAPERADATLETTKASEWSSVSRTASSFASTGRRAFALWRCFGARAAWTTKRRTKRPQRPCSSGAWTRVSWGASKWTGSCGARVRRSFMTWSRVALRRSPCAPPRVAQSGAAGGCWPRRFAEVVVEGARRRLDARRVRRLLGGRGSALRLTDAARRGRLEALGLEPELALLVERHDGARLDALIGAAPPEEGLPGALFALVSAGVIELGAEPTSAVPDETVTAVRAAVEAAHVLAEDGTYFAILGIEPGASGREIRQAYVGRRRWLASLELEALGIERLEPLREEAMRSIDEAYELLKEPGLREAYRGAVAGRIHP